MYRNEVITSYHKKYPSCLVEPLLRYFEDQEELLLFLNNTGKMPPHQENWDDAKIFY